MKTQNKILATLFSMFVAWPIGEYYSHRFEFH